MMIYEILHIYIYGVYTHITYYIEVQFSIALILPSFLRMDDDVGVSSNFPHNATQTQTYTRKHKTDKRHDEMFGTIRRQAGRELEALENLLG